MSEQGPKSIACLGLGAMGSALARSFLKAGLEVHGWNRTAGRGEAVALGEAGARLADSVAAAIEPVPLVLVCLLDYPSVYSAFEGVERSTLEGKVVVNLTTANASETSKMSEWMHERGVKHYFDGAIMNVPQQVGTSEAFTFVSGETPGAFSEVEGALKATGDWDYRGGDPAGAALHDAALLAGLYGLFSGCLTGIALLSKADPEKPGEKVPPTVDMIKKRLVPALTGMLPWVEEASECFDKKDWAGYTASNDVNFHALENIKKTCETKGVRTEGIDAITSLFARAVKDGQGPGGLGYLVNYLLK